MRWLMLLISVLLIGSLFIPALKVPAGMVPICSDSGDLICRMHRQPGIRLIWGTVVPIILLLIVLSHEIWRRICPLSFVSQLGRALGYQRTLTGKGGRTSVAKVDSKSWLARHHLQLQWSLLISGMCLRLLVVNGSPFWLGILLLTTFLAAMVVGWAFNGKAWCQYICPLGPVETVVNGMRGCLGTPAHVGKSSTNPSAAPFPVMGVSTRLASVARRPASISIWSALFGSRCGENEVFPGLGIPIQAWCLASSS